MSKYTRPKRSVNMQLEKKTINGLRWIVGILKKHEIPYRIGGGLAVCCGRSDLPHSQKDHFGLP